MIEAALGGTSYQRVHERLRGDILAGRIAQGERLKISDLARRYGLSHMPVREALQQLQGEGLVELLPNRGASVRRMDARFVRDIFDIRAALESFLAARAADEITPIQLAELERIEAAYQGAAARGDLAERVALNQLFHRTISIVSGNVEAVRLLDLHAGLVGALRVRFGYAEGRTEEIRREHAALLDALARHDGAAAAAIHAEHVRHARDDLLPRLDPLAAMAQ